MSCGKSAINVDMAKDQVSVSFLPQGVNWSKEVEIGNLNLSGSLLWETKYVTISENDNDMTMSSCHPQKSCYLQTIQWFPYHLGYPTLQLQQKVAFFLRLQGQDHQALSSDESRSGLPFMRTLNLDTGTSSSGVVEANVPVSPAFQSLVRDGFIDPKLEPLAKVRKEKLDS